MMPGAEQHPEPERLHERADEAAAVAEELGDLAQPERAEGSEHGLGGDLSGIVVERRAGTGGEHVVEGRTADRRCVD